METKSFEIEGIGKFEFVPELSHEVFFLDKRKRMANLLGGRQGLLELETMINKGLEIDPITKIYKARESATEYQQELAYSALFDYNQASSYLDMQDHIVKYPVGKSLERLTRDEYAKVEEEFDRQLNSFRNPDKEKTESSSSPSES